MSILITTCSLWACASSSHDVKTTAADIPAARPVERGAAGNEDLRVMLAEVASAKACKMIEGQFRPLRDPTRPDVVVGLMWIRGCRITNDGTKVTFDLSGNGWQWADQREEKAGGTFAIKQYVKFAMTAKIPGALDVAYERHDHVVSLWFTPSRTPDVDFEPVGNIAVDKVGLWSSVVGAVGGAIGESPQHLADREAKDQGDHQLTKQLADGISVTIDLCDGLSRFGLGREPKGAMNKPEAGETKRVPIELQKDALMIFGPELVGPAGYTANVDSPNGSVHVDLACREDAEQLAAAYAENKPLPSIKTLASKDIEGRGSVRVAKAECQVSMIARSTNGTPLTFDWQRPATEIARSTGGAIVSCGHPAAKK
ncbi:MAG TPA: hypothetical protein VF407_04145 [Polyangiaceae bacterium]